MRILIVDPDGNRAASLGEALMATGAAVTLAASGSFALTMLEWHRHDVILSRADLGDMPADELCTILRDDPGMKELRFALVVDGPEEVSPTVRSASIDVILPATLSASAMSAQFYKLVPHLAPPPVSVEEDVPPAPDGEESSEGFAGSLDEIALDDLARTIAEAGRTGHLLVALTAGGGAVAFEEGHVVHAEFGDAIGASAFAALIGEARQECAGDFCFVADDSGLRGTPRTVHMSLEELLEES